MLTTESLLYLKSTITYLELSTRLQPIALMQMGWWEFPEATLAMRPNKTNLPLVLLSIRSIVKDDLSCTLAEMVFGISLIVP